MLIYLLCSVDVDANVRKGRVLLDHCRQGGGGLSLAKYILTAFAHSYYYYSLIIENTQEKGRPFSM